MSIFDQFTGSIEHHFWTWFLVFIALEALIATYANGRGGRDE
jgi:hypothetical protein